MNGNGSQSVSIEHVARRILMDGLSPDPILDIYPIPQEVADALIHGTWHEQRKAETNWYHHRDNPFWTARRIPVELRSRGICEVCRWFIATQMNHKHYKRRFRERPEDMNFLCKACHEAHTLQAYSLVPEWLEFFFQVKREAGWFLSSFAIEALETFRDRGNPSLFELFHLVWHAGVQLAHEAEHDDSTWSDEWMKAQSALMTSAFMKHRKFRELEEYPRWENTVTNIHAGCQELQCGPSEPADYLAICWKCRRAERVLNVRKQIMQLERLSEEAFLEYEQEGKP